MMVYSSCDVQAENNGGDGLLHHVMYRQKIMEVMVYSSCDV